MNALNGHPPADRRCQIYITVGSGVDEHLARCVNLGTHWVRWGGCACGAKTDVCEGEMESWECDGPCSPVQLGAA